MLPAEFSGADATYLEKRETGDILGDFEYNEDGKK